MMLGGGGGGAEPAAAAAAAAVTMGKEAEIILPPPTALNPIPALTAALRVDNQEQLLQLLLMTPPPSVKPEQQQQQPPSPVGSRQLLVFGTDSLRTLLLRQVLTDPHSRPKGRKTNWDPYTQFPYLPRGLHLVGTRILLDPGRRQRRRPGADRTGGDPSVWWDDGGSTSFDDNSGGGGGIDETAVDVATYFVEASDARQTRLACDGIRSLRKRSGRIHHRLVYLPQPTALIQKVLGNLGLLAAPHVTVHALQLDLFPLETDVISLEYGRAVAEMDVEGTPSAVIAAVARSLLKLQDVVGKIPRIQSYGPAAEEVLRKLLHVTVDEYLAAKDRPPAPAGGGGGGEAGPVVGGDVAALVIFDRRVDAVTPLVTPLTYEGLLDDLLGIDCGFIGVDVSVIDPDDDETKEEEKKKKNRPAEKVALAMNGSDATYQEVRDQHVEKFGSTLNNKMRTLHDSHADFTTGGKKKDLQEIHQFVKSIPNFKHELRSLTNHIHLAELVKKTSVEATFRECWQLERSILEGETCYDLLEDLVASQQYPPYRFLRLLCLQSVCSGGIKSSRYDALRRDVVQTYGYEYLFVLQNLEKAGLLRRREGLWMDTSSPYNNLRASLSLIYSDVDTVEPDDVSYVSSGYAPLSVRLLQSAMKGWHVGSREAILQELPGRFLDVTQQHPPEDLATAMKRRDTTGLSLAPPSEPQGKKPVLVLMYVGGVTYMEIAALRFLTRGQNFPYHLIICTTKIINGTTLLQSLS
jgi:hypothetical protein